MAWTRAGARGSQVSPGPSKKRSKGRSSYQWSLWVYVINKMSAKSSYSQQIFSSEQEDIECLELREKITTRQIEMHQLVNDRQKFSSHITEMVNLAKTKIDINEKQELKFALIFLREAERIVEYAASSGKTIVRELIVCILHNQASIYQKLWELKNCSSYLEGIIFNYDNYIKETSKPGSTITKDSLPPDAPSLRLKQKLARYNLQYCAVNSQLNDHDAALVAVKKAHALMREAVGGSTDEIRKHFSKEYDCGVDSITKKIDLLMGLSLYDRRFEERGDFGELHKNILKSTHFSLQIWQENKKSKHDYNPQGTQYIEYLNNYSIGNVVEIVPMKYQQTDSIVKQRRQTEREFHVHNKIILLSTCFFSRATELRLKSVQLFKKNPDERKFSRQYKLSINFHLLAIIVVASFIPYNLRYLTEILLSYQKHYSTNLLEYKTVEIESINKILELLEIQPLDNDKTIVIGPPLPVEEVRVEHPQIELKNDYNLKVSFENDKLKKLEKMKSLKKITKELNEPKKFEEKDKEPKGNRSKDNKTSFSISKHEKRERTFSKNQTLKKSPTYRDKDSKNMLASQKQMPKMKEKRSPPANTMGKSRQKDEKKAKCKHYIDETEELFFCFTKKTKKTQGVASPSPSSQMRSSSIGSSSGKSKPAKKSVLSPRNIKVKGTPKTPKSPPKRRNIGEQYYF